MCFNVKCLIKTQYLLIKSVLLQYFSSILKIQTKFSCISSFIKFSLEFFSNLHDSCVHDLLYKLYVRKQSLNFFLTHSARTDCEKWFWWIFLLKSMYFFYYCVQFSCFLFVFFHLIKSLNYVNFMFHFMSLIKLTKYRFFSFSILINCDNNTCLLIRSFFKNCNKLMWNVEWIFILNDNSSLYT